MLRYGIRLLLPVALTFAVAWPVTYAAIGQDPALIKKGVQVYAAQKCNTCHKIENKGKQNVLDGVGSKLSVDEIRQWIVNPKEMATKAKSTKKPPMANKYSGLPAGDIDALVAYMQSLKK